MIVGIVIPTKNRSNFVIQQIRYHASLNSSHVLYIGDSSDEEHAQKTLAVIEELKGKVNVVYQAYPNLNGELAQKKLVNIVKEKYVIYSGDDDTFIPDSLTECAAFLENNPDYSTVHGGVSILLSSEINAGQPRIQSASPYQLKSNNLPLGNQRLVYFLENYWVTQFAVHRTLEYRVAVAVFDDLPDRSYTELICGCASMIQGKAKALNRLYMVRQIHPQRNTLLKSIEWIISPNWQPSFMSFHDKLTELLVEKEGLSLEKSSEIVKKAWLGYLRTVFIKRYNRKSALRQQIKKIPLLESAYKHLKKNLPNAHKKITLEGLLNPNNIYHKDFMPVYNIISSSVL